MDYKAYIAEKIKVDGVDASQIRGMIAVPPTREMGDYALPCFPFAKVLRKSPAMIAEDLAKAIVCDNVIESVTALSGYLNFRISRFGLTSAVLSEVSEKGEAYGSSTEGEGKVICIDYSSINIAKPFHIGHLLTTVIGGALYRIFNFLGYKAVGINHLGDWGTQFGKLISAYKRWGDEEKIQSGRVRELMKIYVRFHEEAEKNPDLEEEARGYFKKIEEGDAECLRLFHWFRDLTLLDVQKIYDLLNIKFDSYAGESFYNDKMQPVIDRLQEKGLLKESEGAKVVDLEEHGMPPCLILKADGATLYATRDLAAAYYRKQTYDFYKCLYVVAYQQNLHFKQIFKVLDLLGEDFAGDMEHVAFGMVSLASGAMSTRKGNVVFLEDVIETCIQKSRELMEERNRELENKEEVSRMVGTAAVIFGALLSSKIKDVVFDINKVTNFDGETGPYVQYTAARCASVLEKAGEFTFNPDSVCPVTDAEFEVASLLAAFPETVRNAAEKREPSFVTRFAVDLAQAYNKFYFECKILDAEPAIKAMRLALTKATHTVIKTALALLGIEAPQRM